MDCSEKEYYNSLLLKNKSAQNLSCFIDHTPQKLRKAKNNRTQQHKEKLDEILKSLQSFRSNCQAKSTKNLNSTQIISESTLNLHEAGNTSLFIDQKPIHNKPLFKEKQQKEYLLNNGNKALKRQQGNNYRQLSHQYSSKDLSFFEKCKQNDGKTTQQKNEVIKEQNSVNTKFNKNQTLQFQKKQIQAMKEKLQKFGINILEKSERLTAKQQSQRQLIKGNLVKYQQDKSNGNKVQQIPKYHFQNVLNKKCKINQINSLQDQLNPTLLQQTTQSPKQQTTLLKRANSHEETVNLRPLTSLKEKDQLYDFRIKQLQNQKEHVSDLQHRSYKKLPSMQDDQHIDSHFCQFQKRRSPDNSCADIITLKQNNQKSMLIYENPNEISVSPMNSFTQLKSVNSFDSEKQHKKHFNMNMQNFAGESYQVGLDISTEKIKPGSFSSNEKPKLSDSNDSEFIAKPKAGSYGCKKSTNQKFQPVSSISKQSIGFLKEKDTKKLKETIETDCTYGRLYRKLSIKDFSLGKQIGKGKFGRVYIGVHNETGFCCAIKIIKKQMTRKERNIEQLIRQIKIQSFLNHSNNTKMYGYFDDSEKIYLLIEYCIEGQLYTLLKKKGKFKEDQAIPIIKDICQGLNHLHSLKIIHRDIKPENVVMCYKMAKLCDFGWSVNSNNQKRQTFCGTPLYVSPELLMGKTYDYKVDVWALGIMVFELLTGKLPFQINNQNQLRKIVTVQVKYPEDMSQCAKNFIWHLLQKNPAYRNDMETILKHKFLVQGLQRIKNKTKQV